MLLDRTQSNKINKVCILNVLSGNYLLNSESFARNRVRAREGFFKKTLKDREVPCPMGLGAEILTEDLNNNPSVLSCTSAL